ncbi:ABC transporter ATP-binding protein [Atribacter laminatus]|jgi:ABC-type multidrug transport system fused ATPase/permease subunit|uniref:Multidrug export ATP-binding/permease protein n=1 Tax=Atribacter laminatus TaxID=2847778 RepID=A0A7T1AJZ3_ATRLM|nr:ABC transporter ATP-binding protein [Atribacter laminatus]QPM67318.1 Putative multidrug export ATP-binding/permease protein [Atribacter laminatus]
MKKVHFLHSFLRGFSPLSFLKIFTTQEKRQMFILLFLMILMGLFQAIGVASILPFMNLVLNPEMVETNQWLKWFYQWGNFQNLQSFVITVGFITLGIIILANAISALTVWMRLRFTWRNNHLLSQKLLYSYLSRPYSFFLNRNSADLGKNVLSEVQQLTNGFLIPFFTMISDLFVVLFVLLLLFFVNPSTTLVTLLLLGVPYFIVYWLNRRRLGITGVQRIRTNRERYTSVNEAFGGIKDLKLMGRESYYFKKFSSASHLFSNLMISHSLIGSLPRFALETIAFGGIIVLVLYLLRTGGSASEIIPMVSLYAFAGYRLMPALQQFFLSLTQVRFNYPTVLKVTEELSGAEQVVPEGIQNFVDKPPLPFQKEIRLERVNFYYPEVKEPVLRDISLTIPWRTSVAFVGPTGSGKTTTVDLILGLLDPTSGEILIDGIPLTNGNKANWQENLGYVPQQIFLSDDTVTNNIAFGIPEQIIDHQAVELAARTAGIHDFIINELPKDYQTIVGERGIRLSGGQRQRIGIARALYHDPEVLVLDEATSSLDVITEEMVYQAIENLSKMKTLIIIAHRLSTVRNCDTIYLIDRGSIIAQGKFDVLANENPQFQEIVRKYDRHN